MWELPIWAAAVVVVCVCGRVQPRGEGREGSDLLRRVCASPGETDGEGRHGITARETARQPELAALQRGGGKGCQLLGRTRDVGRGESSEERALKGAEAARGCVRACVCVSDATLGVRCDPVGDLDCLRVRCADLLSLRPGLPLLALKGAGDRNGDTERRHGMERTRGVQSY